jgi:hypothetical protein
MKVNETRYYTIEFTQEDLSLLKEMKNAKLLAADFYLKLLEGEMLTRLSLSEIMEMFKAVAKFKSFKEHDEEKLMHINQLLSYAASFESTMIRNGRVTW